MSLERRSVVNLLRAMAGRRLLVVGDFMVDQTVYGEARRISPEAPTPVILVRETRRQLGGAGNVVRNIDSLGGQVFCAGLLGDDETAGFLKELLCEVRACQACCLVREQGRKTTLKTRVVAVQAGRAHPKAPYGHQQVLRLDEETSHPLSSDGASQIVDFAASVIAQVDGVVLSDYAKGALTVPLLQELISLSRSAGKPVFGDPKARDWQRYRGASVLTPNAAEAEAALGISFTPSEDAVDAGWEATVQERLEELGLEALLVTRGAEGLSLVDRRGFHHFPTFAREVFDVTGAGDTVLAAFALAAVAGAPYPQAAHLANLAAGVAVAKAGAAAVHPFEVERDLDARHFSAEAKIRSREEIASIAETLRREHRKIVFTNGCFDLLHAGHMYLLREAKKFGDILIVGLNSDASVRRLKGDGRPIVPAEDRANAMAALESVDYLVVFDEADPMDLLQRIRPDALVKGNDYAESEVVGADFLKSYGGSVCLVPIREGISTTRLVERIRSTPG
ncbi:MAG: D-glycero-beta-D-manno-heptose 1-phosphate adenylyltransferase [Acidobacteria bacterium]|nr:D-glycero-beta-D-manno-heptose 1-phosphate adenylyltransferase [Acidobacteriota bacterium]